MQVKQGVTGVVVALAAVTVVVLLGFFPPVRDWVRGPQSVQAPSEKSVGSITTLVKEVRHRNQAGFEWLAAREGQSLQDGDKVRTGSESEAIVKFLEGSDLLIGAQALVTIRAPRAEEGESDLVAEVEVEGGEVRVALARGGDGGEKRMRVQSGGRTVANLSTSSAKDGVAEMSVLMRPDRSLRIVSVRGGGVKVGGKGKQIVLDEGQAATEGKEGATAAVSLPAPALGAPADGAQLAAGAVTLEWGSVKDAGGYVVEIAKDARFLSGKTTSKTSSTQHVATIDTPGGRFWRVAAVDATKEVGAFARAHRFEVGAPLPSPSPSPSPSPTLRLPPVSSVLQGEEGKPLLVSGRAKPGTSLVNVNGKPAQVHGGRYELALENLRPGAQKITVEEIDAEGNVTYTKRDVVIREKK